MARRVAESCMMPPVSSDVRFAIATAEDDAAIRRLLHENPTDGDISLSFEREPNYFVGQNIAGAIDQTVVAYEQDKLVCMGRCSVRERFVNGEAQRVGYLGELRLDYRARGRFDILRRGYEFFHQHSYQCGASVFFTSIATDNERSKRFLEAKLRGMPEYRFLCEFTTALISAPRSQHSASELLDAAKTDLNKQMLTTERARTNDCAAIVDFLNQFSIRHQLATRWTTERLLNCGSVGLRLDDIYVIRASRQIMGCVALWDQRCFRQLVIRGYDPKLSFLKPLINFAAPAFGSPKLPKIGEAIALAYASPFAIGDELASNMWSILSIILAEAANRGVEMVCISFDSSNPRWHRIKTRFAVREYKSRLYSVLWPGGKEARFDQRPFLPELAFL